MVDNIRNAGKFEQLELEISSDHATRTDQLQRLGRTPEMVAKKAAVERFKLDQAFAKIRGNPGRADRPRRQRRNNRRNRQNRPRDAPGNNGKRRNNNNNNNSFNRPRKQFKGNKQQVCYSRNSADNDALNQLLEKGAGPGPG